MNLFRKKGRVKETIGRDGASSRSALHTDIEGGLHGCTQIIITKLTVHARIMISLCMISGVDSWLRTNPVVTERIGPSQGSFIFVRETVKLGIVWLG